jgi:hypothetical protein
LVLKPLPFLSVIHWRLQQQVHKTGLFQRAKLELLFMLLVVVAMVVLEAVELRDQVQVAAARVAAALPR